MDDSVIGRTFFSRRSQLPAPARVSTAVDESGETTIDPDAALMVRVGQGDEAAFKVLFDKHRKAIVNFSRRYLGTTARAEDAAQEAFLRLYRARADYEPRTKFTTYLYRIATNTCLNHLRQRDYAQKDEPEVDVLDPTPAGPEQTLRGQQLQTLIEKIMSEMPEQQRTAFVLARTDDLSYEQIAEIMNTTVPAVKSLINRAKVLLATKLAPYMNETEPMQPGSPS